MGGVDSGAAKLSGFGSMPENAGMINLGLDIDGTITSDPKFFASICQGVLIKGAVHIVSSRSPEARTETVAELAELGISYSALHLLPPLSAAQSLCPHSGLDWYQRHQWLKADYALSNRLTHFVDDDRKVLALFARFAPSVAAIDFKDRELLLELIRPADG